MENQVSVADFMTGKGRAFVNIRVLYVLGYLCHHHLSGALGIMNSLSTCLWRDLVTFYASPSPQFLYCIRHYLDVLDDHILSFVSCRWNTQEMYISFGEITKPQISMPFLGSALNVLREWLVQYLLCMSFLMTLVMHLYISCLLHLIFEIMADDCSG